MSRSEIIIEPGAIHRHYWRDIWSFRELFYCLAWRDLLVRYKQTAIGVSWALIRPLLTMLVFSLVFGGMAHLPSGGMPYPLLVLSAMLPWQFFANAVSECSNSLIANSNMISKVYFPRLIVPVSSVIVSFVDFLISGVILLAMMAWYRFVPGERVLALPIFILEGCVAALGAGFWFSVLNVKYRDFRYIVGFIVQLGVYISPVGFISNLVPGPWQWMYSLNPLVGIIDGFRWAILGLDDDFLWIRVAFSWVFVILIFCSGLWYFRTRERKLVDII